MASSANTTPKELRLQGLHSYDQEPSRNKALVINSQVRPTVVVLVSVVLEFDGILSWQYRNVDSQFAFDK